MSDNEKKNWQSILVVDDDASAIKIIRPILLDKGYSVLTADTGEEGLMIAQMQNPDMIILDVIMPGIKGRDVCQRLKEDKQTKHIPVIFLTAKNSPDDVEAEMSAGAVTHLTKPVDPVALLKAVEHVFNQA